MLGRNFLLRQSQLKKLPVVNVIRKRSYTPPRPPPQLPRQSRIITKPPPKIRQRIIPDEVYYPSTGSTVLSDSDPITDILSHHTIVIERQIEFMNLFIGFEQANKYILMDTNGNQLGFALERDVGITKMIMRQMARLHRPFVVDVFDNAGQLLLTIKRPFSFINSHIKAILPGFQNQEDGLIIGESIQSWHLWRRRYNLFLNEAVGETSGAVEEESFEQFGAIDAPFLSFEFPVMDHTGAINGCVDRNWVGLGRELFTDTGVYIMRMAPASFQGLEDNFGSSQLGPGLTLDQRAVMLGTAISIDFDYFSRHSTGHGGGGFGIFPFGGGEGLVDSESGSDTGIDIDDDLF